MKPLLPVFAFLLAFSLSTSLFAQPDALNRAMRTLTKVDSLLGKNPNDTLSTALRQDMDEAAVVFGRFGKRFEEAGTRFYRANVAEGRWQPDSMFADLQRADSLLHNLKGDSIDLMRGHIWNALNAYHANFKFDFYKANQALKRSGVFYKDAGRDDLVMLNLGNYAVALANFGQGSLALSTADSCKVRYNKLSAEVKAKSDITMGFIHYIYGMANFILSDSLFFAGETEAMQQYAQKAIDELDSILPGERVDLARLANTWYLKGLAYYRLPGGLDSAWYYMDKATGIYAFAGANPRSPYGLGQVFKGVVLLRKDSIEQGQELVTSGLKDLGYSTGGFFSKERSTASPTFLQVQALIIKLNVMELVYQKHPDRKWLEQMVFDTEVLAGMMEALKDNYKDRVSLERLSDRLSYFYAWGVAAARDLAAAGGPEADRWKEQGLRLSELGKGYALRFQIAKRIPPGGLGPGNGGALIEGTDMSLSSIRAHLLDESTVAIEFSLGFRSATAIVVTQNHVEMVALPVLATWKRDLEFADSLLSTTALFEEASARLYRVLLEPLLPYIPTGTRHLVIIPDSYLWRLNFDALVTGKKSDGKYSYLIETYALSQSYSLQIANWMATNQLTKIGRGKFLGLYIGNFKRSSNEESNISEEFTSIPKLKMIAENIYKRWQESAIPVKLDTVPKAQEFTQDLYQFDLVLVGTHGVAKKSMLPENYYLAFNDNDSAGLKVSDVYRLNSTTMRTKFLFLASCLTAYGKDMILGEGLPSISRAFHYAGIPTIVTAAKKIPVGSTARITELFFNAVMENDNITIASALQKAKVEYIQESSQGKNIILRPKFWASLMCLGYGNLRL